MKASIAQVLKDEGYIADFSVEAKKGVVKKLNIKLKYYNYASKKKTPLK